MKAGVLIASYGAPRSLEEIESYFTHIRRGHPPKPEELADLLRRYRTVGGTDRLLRETERQVAALRRVLAALLFPDELPLVSAYRHAPPYLEDGVRALAAQGVRSILLLPLAPHYSPAHHVEYVERVRRAAESLGLEAHVVEDFGNHPCLVAWWAEAVRKAWEDADSYVLFTAHSLPVPPEDPYVRSLERLAAAVARAAEVPEGRYRLAFQSAGRPGLPWIGPDVGEVLPEVARRARSVLVAPIGFVSEHLEVVYDLDVEAKAIAEAHGLAFHRLPLPGSSSAFVGMLAALVLGGLRRMRAHAEDGRGAGRGRR
ncbi:MAG: ferrochelatase [Brockia lithotrophica]|nr:ferrochelatase [Brockia lithotrophica]